MGSATFAGVGSIICYTPFCANGSAIIAIIQSEIIIEKTKAIGQEGIIYWQSVIEDYHTLSKEEAIKALIKSEKIEEKIRTIKRMIAKDVPG